MWTPTSKSALVLLVLLLANGGPTILALPMPASFASALSNPSVELGAVLEGNTQTCTRPNATEPLNTTLTPLHTLPEACGVQWDMHAQLPGYMVEIFWLLEPDSQLAHFGMHLRIPRTLSMSQITPPRFFGLSFPTGPCRHPSKVGSEYHVVSAECRMYPADAVLAKWDPDLEDWTVAPYTVHGYSAGLVVEDPSQTLLQASAHTFTAGEDPHMNVTDNLKNATDGSNITGTASIIGLSFTRAYDNGGRVRLFKSTLEEEMGRSMKQGASEENMVVQNVNWAVGPIPDYGILNYHGAMKRGSLTLLASVDDAPVDDGDAGD